MGGRDDGGGGGLRKIRFIIGWRIGEAMRIALLADCVGLAGLARAEGTMRDGIR